MNYSLVRLHQRSEIFLERFESRGVELLAAEEFYETMSKASMVIAPYTNGF